jgi:uncharacterized protein with von Willebrand factor type A (vWA) domain
VSDVAASLVRFGDALREGGVRVGVGQMLTAHRALQAVDATSREASYHALRAALCARRDDLEVFDEAFAACFAAPGLDEELLAALPQLELPKGAAEGHGEGETDDPSLEAEPVPAAYSEVELLKAKDFAQYTDEERAVARELIARLARRGPVRSSRRTASSRRRGDRLDLRETVRASLAYGGEPIERRWRAPVHRPRPLVLVCDISGSMEQYARMLLQYLHAAVASRRRAEGFVFGTRLTRITGELRSTDPDTALARASEAVVDWQGGTRIGEALATLNREHGRWVGRGAVVVVLSDGWDRGDPDLLGAETARLARCAHRLVWCNPLKSRPGYEPLAQGMAAALPHVDDFLSGDSVASLMELALILEGGPRR